MQIKQIFLLLVHKSRVINFISFSNTYAKPEWHTVRLSTESRSQL